MRLYRLCSPQEISAIKKGEKRRLYFGASLYRYVNLEGKEDFCNSYPFFQNMFDEIKCKQGEEKIKPILKMFPNLPKEIPLFEKNVLKRREIGHQFDLKRFVFYSDYSFECFVKSSRIVEMMNETAEENHEIFWISIKVAGFFDNLENVETYYNAKQEISPSEERILAIDFPEETALKFKGQGIYDLEKFGCIQIKHFDEYALPMYAIKPDHVVADFDIFDETWDKFGGKSF